METALTNHKDDEGEVGVIPAPASEATQAAVVSGSLGNSLVSEQEEDDDEPEEVQDEEDESEYEYEDEDETAFGGFLTESQAVVPVGDAATTTTTTTTTTTSSSSATTATTLAPTSAPAHIRDDDEPPKPVGKSSTWREPSKEAVNMSLRAERETTGGKRRLASDLYRIMMADTKEAGFSLEPKSEDSMDKWTIKLFQFDEDSNLHKDMMVLGLDHIELEMSFPDQYPFEPPFVRVVRPKFKRQTGFVMNGALCMELLTKDGWNPVNDIESVIVSIRSLLVVGDGRLAAAADLSDAKRQEILGSRKRGRDEKDEASDAPKAKVSKAAAGQYSLAEAQAAYSHLSDYHKKKGWDTSGWWARKG